MPVHLKDVGNGRFMLAEPSGAISPHRKAPGAKATVAAQARAINAAISKKEAMLIDIHPSDYMKAAGVSSNWGSRLHVLKARRDPEKREEFKSGPELEKKMAALCKLAGPSMAGPMPAQHPPLAASIHPPKPPAPAQQVPAGASLADAPVTPGSGLPPKPATAPAAPAASAAPVPAAPTPAPAPAPTPAATPPAQQSAAPPGQTTTPASVPQPGR